MTDWQRTLWTKQTHPDNYIPNSFLSSLKRNPNFEPYTYHPLVLSACAVAQHLSSIFIFLNTFVHLYDKSWDPRIIVWVSICMFSGGFVVWAALEYMAYGTWISGEQRSKALKSSILVFLALLALSPVLRTLSASTSSDSIWALTACLFVPNIVLADYGSSANSNLFRGRLTSVLSTNAAMSAAVVLSSRLRDDISVFALMLFSIQIFALFPILRTRLLLLPNAARILLTIFIVVLSIYLNIDTSPLVSSVQAILHGLVLFGGPAILVWAQKFKNEIRGPWDVAVPQLR